MTLKLLIKNIKALIQTENRPKLIVKGKDMKKLSSIENAFLLIDGDKISDFGDMLELQSQQSSTHFFDYDKEIDAAGRYVFPCWCDSHTHLVYSGSREREFVDKINGISYEEIARKGGGILNSAKKLQETPEEELIEQSLIRINEIIAMGTGAVEIKSGYGLTFESEMKMLKVIRKLKELSPLTIKSTFLGAHAIPLEYVNNRKAYIDLIINKMLPQIAREKLADYCDVFCDRGFFTPEETDMILQAGNKLGLPPKIHANELDYSGGIQVGVKNKAVSVDHLECTGDEEIKTLLNSETMPTLLPGTAFFLKLPYPPARKMIDAGLPVALASDYNPGSCPSGKMSFIISLACIYMKMSPEETINAVTINGAYAMNLSDKLGSIAKGKVANVFITKAIPSLSYLPYSFGSNLIETVILNGKII